MSVGPLRSIVSWQTTMVHLPCVRGAVGMKGPGDIWLVRAAKAQSSPGRGLDGEVVLGQVSRV